MEAVDEKTRLRAEVRSRLAALRPLVRAQEEELVNAAVLADPVWQAARTVLLYRAKPPELSVTSLGNAAFRDGKRVVFPRVEPDGLGLFLVPDWSAFEAGAFGLQEPLATCERVEPEAIDLAVVPGVAWTLAGDRLGQGGGFYDRLLPRLGGPAWGVGFGCQVMEALPMESHDRRVDRVIHPGAAT